MELHVSLARPCSNRGLLPLPLPYLSTGHADVLRLLHLEGARREGSNAPQQRQQALLDVLEGSSDFHRVCCGAKTPAKIRVSMLILSERQPGRTRCAAHRSPNAKGKGGARPTERLQHRSCNTGQRPRPPLRLGLARPLHSHGPILFSRAKESSTVEWPSILLW